MSLKHAFCQYLKRFGTAAKKEEGKQKSVKHAL